MSAWIEPIAGRRDRARRYLEALRRYRITRRRLIAMIRELSPGRAGHSRLRHAALEEDLANLASTHLPSKHLYRKHRSGS